jgi:hypothetical protein
VKLAARFKVLRGLEAADIDPSGSFTKMLRFLQLNAIHRERSH